MKLLQPAKIKILLSFANSDSSIWNHLFQKLELEIVVELSYALVKITMTHCTIRNKYALQVLKPELQSVKM